MQNGVKKSSSVKSTGIKAISENAGSCIHFDAIKPPFFSTISRRTMKRCTSCEDETFKIGSRFGICLTCGHVGCLNPIFNHMMNHFVLFPTHSMVLNMASFTITCLICNVSYLPENLLSLKKFMKRIISFRNSQVDLLSQKQGINKTPTGLQNLGFTCYLNSVIQCLFVLPCFRETMLELSNKMDITLKPLSSKKDPLDITVSNPYGPVSYALYKIFTLMKECNYTLITPVNFHTAIRTHLPCFVQNMMHDSHEFLLCLLDLISHEIKRSTLIVIKERMVQSEDNLQDYNEIIPNFFSQTLFNGEFSSEIICEKCHKKKSTMESFLDLSLPIRLSQKTVAHRFFQLINRKLEKNVDRSKCKSDRTGERTSPSILNNNILHISGLPCVVDKNFNQDVPSSAPNMNYRVDCRMDTKISLSSRIRNLGKSIFNSNNLGSAGMEPSKNNPIDNVSANTQSALNKEGNNIININECIRLSDMSEECSIQSMENDKKPNKFHKKSSSDGLYLMSTDNHDLDEIHNSFDRSLSLNSITDILPLSLELQFSDDHLQDFEPKDRPFKHSDAKERTIYHCLNQFFAAEMLEENNKIFCHHCSKLGKSKIYCEAQKKFRVKKLPQHLIIHLKRFRDNGRKITKLCDHIKFPEVLELHDYVYPNLKEKEHIYNLCGVIEHTGSLDQGHYISYVKFQSSSDPKLSKWFLANDHIVKSTRIQTVLKANAYLLFYDRVV